jgi:hypothetical protein
MNEKLKRELTKTHSEEETIKLLKEFGIEYRVKYQSLIKSCISEFPVLKKILIPGSLKSERPVFGSRESNTVIGEEVFINNMPVSTFMINVILDRLTKEEQ